MAGIESNFAQLDPAALSPAEAGANANLLFEFLIQIKSDPSRQAQVAAVREKLAALQARAQEAS